MVGDRIKNTAGRIGTVTEIRRYFGGLADDKLTIKWDDGVVPVGDYPISGFGLISRAVGS